MLSQLFVVSTFFVIFKFSEDFFKDNTLSLLSLLLLEGIYFYNFTTPEFNVNVCQLPFWALTVHYSWKAIKEKNYINWLFFGIFATLGLLSKYLFLYLIMGIKVYFIYLITKRKKIEFVYFIPLIVFIIMFSPHLIWLIENNYITLTYALHRTGLDEPNFINHLFNPIIFLSKQIGILLPFFIMFLFVFSKLKPKFNLRDKKLLFLISINFIPIFLMFLTSLFFGVKIRTMWMTPFYLFSGILLIYVFQHQINLKKLKHFILVFLILFIFSPVAYLYVSVTQTDKRTDYPGNEIAKSVQQKWDNNFKNTIKTVIGDEWHAGNLSYHLKSNPRWYSHSNAFVEKSVDDFIETIGKDGFIIVNGECSQGTSFIIKNINICIHGEK